MSISEPDLSVGIELAKADEAKKPKTVIEAQPRIGVISKHEAKFGAVYAVILAVALAAIYALIGVAHSHAKPIVKTRSVPAAVSTTASLETALGKPAGSVPGDQINAQLKGTTCDVYQRKADVTIVCHA